MSDFRGSVNDYLSREQSLAQANLQAKEQMLGTRAQLKSASMGQLEGEAANAFSDKLKEEGNKMMSEIGIDLGTSAVAPSTLRFLSKAAKAGSDKLNNVWKTKQSERYKEDDPLDLNESDMKDLFGETEPIRKPTQLTTGEALKATPLQADYAEDGSNTIKTLSSEKIPFAATEAEGTASDLGKTAAAEGEEAVSDLAPEITAGVDALSGLGDTLSTLAEGAGYIGGAIGLGMSIYDMIKGAHDAAKDPYAAIRPKLQEAQGKINALENTVSADQFESKLGIGTPSYGSFAARPTLDTSKTSGVALNF